MTEMTPLQLAETAAKLATPKGATPKDYQLTYLSTWVEMLEAMLRDGGYRAQLDDAVKDWDSVAHVLLEKTPAEGDEDSNSWVGEITFKVEERETYGRSIKIRAGAFEGRTAADEAVAFFTGRGLEVVKDTRKGYEGESVALQLQFA